MNTPLRILLIDDNPDDRTLVLRELRREFADLRVEQVVGAQGLAEVLETGDFDVVVTDYQLRWTDGLAVLDAVKTRWPDCPVIMFTGTGSEEIAVEAMKKGLDDYVLKSPKHFVRLPAAVRSALDRSRKRRALREAQEALRQSEEHYRAVVENVADAICINVGTKRVFVNKAFLSLHGLDDMSQAVDTSLDHFIVPEDVELVRERTLARQQGRAVPGVYEYRVCRPDGELRTVQTSSVAITYEGQPAALAVLRDVTERMQAEEAIRETKAFYERLVGEAGDAILVIDREGVILTWNTGAEQIFGWSAQEALGHSYLRLQSGDVTEGITANMQRIFAGETLSNLETRRCRKDGTWFDALLTVSPVHDRNGVVIAAQGIIKDITERKRAEEALRESSRRLVEALEVERRHIARELHDEIGQALTGLKLSLEVVTQRLGEHDKAGVLEAQGLVNELVGKVRDLSLDLRPAMLDDLGLLAALLWHYGRFTSQTDVKVIFEHAGVERRFQPEVETTAYRIVQEALTNVARHAGVSEVRVRLWADRDTLGVQIEDRGAGFDPETELVAGVSSGLSGMYERAALLGGRLTVESGPGAGTLVTAEFPLDRRKNRKDES